MFRDLFLSGGIGGFDVTKLFREGDNKYVWLAAELLNTRHLQSLSNFIDMKKQLIIFVDTEVIPTLISLCSRDADKENTLIREIFKYMGSKAKESSDYGYSLEYFIKKMVDPGEDYSPAEKPVIKVDDFKWIFTNLNQEVIERL